MRHAKAALELDSDVLQNYERFVHNRLENLREVTRSENQYNKGMCKSNTSGFRGVSWHKHSKSWVVRVCTKGKSKSIGYFKDLELAGLVADEARALHHGKFAKQF